MANTVNIYVNKADLGLDLVDNTADLDKPVSTATQTALNNYETKITADNSDLLFRFDQKTFHATPTLGTGYDPLTGNIGVNMSTPETMLINMTSVMLHNDSVEPTFTSEFEMSADSLPYITGQDNYIYATLINKSPLRIIYQIKRGGTNLFGTFLTTDLKGANNGVAELDSNGKVPSAQLPSYVDDVEEYADLAGFPVTGESGKIYIAIDTNLTYRWGGSTYVEISPSLALGETSASAYRGDRGKIAYDHSQLTSGNPHNVTKSDVGLSNCDNTSDANKPISTATQTALNNKVTGVASSLNNTVPVFDGTTGKLIKQGIITDNGTNIGIGIGSPTEMLHVNGNATADNYFINNVPYAILPYRYRKNVTGISNAAYTTLCNVNSIALSSGVRISIMGTTAGTVITVVADIIVNYFQDIYIESKSGIYSFVTLKVISDDGENFTIQATTNSAGVLTAEIEVFPLNSESVVFDPATIYSGTTHTHQCVPGFSVSATGGTSLQNGNITTLGNVGIGTNTPTEKLHVVGNIIATNLSGTNTGDQDLSGYATKNITLDRKTASYTLVANDNGKMIEMNVATANTLTIDASIFSAGNQILISQYGTGQTTITAGAGVTLRSSGGKLKTSAQYSLVTIIAISSTEFYVAGDLTA